MNKKSFLNRVCMSGLASVFAFSAMAANTDEKLMKFDSELKQLMSRQSRAMDFSGYTDIEYRGSTKEGTEHGFRLHHLSFFMKKHISNQWFFFSEIEFENAPRIEGNDEEVMLDASGNPQPMPNQNASEGKLFVEAVNLTYQFGGTHLRMGRFFTPAGIWLVDHYPQNVPTQVLPQHIQKIFPQVIDGAAIMGAAKNGDTLFNYDIYFGNGEGNAGDADRNSDKSFGLKGALLMPWGSHFELGLSLYSDTLNDESVKQSAGLHGRFQVDRSQYQFEYAKSEIEDPNGSVVESEGYYFQVTYQWDNLLVGSRYDYYDDNVLDGQLSDKHGDSLGMFFNYHFDNNVVFKTEIHNFRPEDDEDEITTNLVVSIVAGLGR